MVGPVHTYGPTCLLKPPEEDLRAIQSSPTPPPVNAQFFYTSNLPIDDPLTPLPTPSTKKSSAQALSSPQPFSARDNIALETAWRALGKEVKEAQQRGKNAAGRTGGEDARPGTGRTSMPVEMTPSDSGTQEVPLPARRLVELSGRSTPSQFGEDGHDSGGASRDSFHEPTSATRISGSPFARVSSRHSRSSSAVESQRHSAHFSDADFQDEPQTPLASGSRPRTRDGDQQSETISTAGGEEESARYKVPVGVSRLHLVEFPGLKMKPIYWSPLHDISDVLRATWFYKNTMLPVEPQLANELERGYVYMRAWTDTWQDELNSCVEHGAEAEMKVVYKLWMDDPVLPPRLGSTADKCDESGTSWREPTFDINEAASGSEKANSLRPFKKGSVIYVNAKEAQILRPSLLPSVSKNRRPLSSIRKGRQIGIPVVRGFDRKRWDELHPSKQTPLDLRHYIMRPQARTSRGQQICYACAIEESRPTPSDLVLVIHGIGQKLSERVESFHFTHAVNGFRRTVNMELNNEAIWPHIRPDHGGIMVLPVNWRSTLELEDADGESLNVEDPATNKFTLKDITPDTIPAIRTLISDVMLDIPYYLSHHKEKMIRAVVKEANRVYRLWCKNNPGFQEYGRVHLIAHSLGSAMATDILSKQPTKLPKIDIDSPKIEERFFEFDSKNVFFCGSPVGLFLLLNRANLLPRRGRNKPGHEGDDLAPGIAGEANTYGCLALDNLYNIMHTTDPIAYRLNAAVDRDLAESLKPAAVPSSSTSLLSSFGSVFRRSRSNAGTVSAASSRPATGTVPPGPTVHPGTAIKGTSATNTQPDDRPTSALSQLPSTVELETHNFTREEIAEKRMYLLNDNGQIDWTISGGGGPLNIQYLNMLSAHSSYWILPDFVRFVVVEIARRQDKHGTLMALRAVKKKGWRK